jgi:hypothetical protein
MRTIEEEMRLKREQKKKAKAPAKKDASVDQSLKSSLWESGFFGAMFGATEQFFVPFALLFGAGLLRGRYSHLAAQPLGIAYPVEGCQLAQVVRIPAQVYGVTPRNARSCHSPHSCARISRE